MMNAIRFGKNYAIHVLYDNATINKAEKAISRIYTQKYQNLSIDRSQLTVSTGSPKSATQLQFTTQEGDRFLSFDQAEALARRQGNFVDVTV